MLLLQVNRSGTATSTMPQLKPPKSKRTSSRCHEATRLPWHVHVWPHISRSIEADTANTLEPGFLKSLKESLLDTQIHHEGRAPKHSCNCKANLWSLSLALSRECTGHGNGEHLTKSDVAASRSQEPASIELPLLSGSHKHFRRMDRRIALGSALG